MKKNPHTTFTKGKRIIIKLCSGEIFLDKFIEKLSKGIMVETREFIPTKEIKSITIYRGNNPWH